MKYFLSQTTLQTLDQNLRWYTISPWGQHPASSQCFDTDMIYTISMYHWNLLFLINVRKYRRDNQKWTIQRNWQYRVHTTKTNTTKTQQNVLDTAIRKQTQKNVNKTRPSYKQLEVNHLIL